MKNSLSTKLLLLCIVTSFITGESVFATKKTFTNKSNKAVTIKVTSRTQNKELKQREYTLQPSEKRVLEYEGRVQKIEIMRSNNHVEVISDKRKGSKHLHVNATSTIAMQPGKRASTKK